MDQQSARLRELLVIIFLTAVLAQSAAGQFCTQYEVFRLNPPEPAADRFSVKLNLSYPWVGIGAKGTTVEDANGAHSGAVYLYLWQENDQILYRQRLVASNPTGGQFLGSAVGMTQSHIVVGAFQDSGPCGGYECYAGSAYVFRRDDMSTPENLMDDVWLEQTQLFALNPEPEDYFGEDADIHGDWIVVGAEKNRSLGGSGSAFVYHRDDNTTPNNPTDDTWPLHAELTSPGVTQNPDDSFGADVAVWENRVVVGAPEGGGFTPGNPPGRAYVFRRDDPGTPGDVSDDTWSLEDTLLPKYIDFGAIFGNAVDIEGDLIAVGMPGDQTFHVLQGGSVYAFRLDDGNTPGDPTDDSWNYETRMANGKKFDNVGWDVAVSGNRILAEAWNHIPTTFDTGAGFVFRYAGGQWHKEQRLLGSDIVQSGAELGQMVAMEGNRILLSQDMTPSWGLGEGVYIYEVIDDCDGDCVSDADEIVGGAADVNGNGVPDTCEDCNNNGTIDSVEVGGGQAMDCNSNGLPDSCDVISKSSEDCNTNAIPDECDLAAAAAPDCNLNLVPDECDIAVGRSDDDNGNSIPDECDCPNQSWGDVNTDDTVDLFDILCVLDGFAGVFTTCPMPDVDLIPCAPDGLIDIFDILAVLDAFAGTILCCDLP
ncbi:MAG: hypothetical protein HOP29_16075 [Phycisphaerales bacterium]|nr:hypothetical protein [Phycisphaerales bacterium]